MDYFVKKLLPFSLLAVAIGCTAVKDPDMDPDPDPDPTPVYTYRTTSNVGDMSTWTIDGNQLSAEWKDIAPVTGDVERTYLVNAVCGTPDADFGYRTCMVDGDSECVDGVAVCTEADGPKNGDTFRVFEVPGMALVVSSQNDEQLHAGFSVGGCESFGVDDYTFVNLGHSQSEIVGLFRTDASFSPVYHMEFGFTDDPDNRISYDTNDPGGLLTGMTPGACVDGVRELTIDGTNDKVRLMITAAGHLVVDKPEGEGGMLAITADNAASINDFANKTWGGLSFPDNSPPEYIQLTTGAVENGRVLVTSIKMSASGDITPDTPVYINSGAASPTLNQELAELGQPYASNHIVASGSYTNGPSELPGVFEIDSVVGDETAILGIGATVNGKTMLFGAVVNVTEEQRNGVKGNFILFER